MVTTALYVRQQKRHRCIEQSFGLCGRGSGGMIWENAIETCIISYKKRISSPGFMQDTGCLGLVHWDDPSILYHALNLDWRSVSYTVLYMFQCHSPKSSHLSLSHRVQKTVLYISVSFAVSYTGLLLPSF